RIHPIFSTQHLQKVVPDPHRRVCRPPPVDVFEGEDAFEIDYVFGERKRGRRTEFKVKWKGYADTEFTWE
ncbi:hypothetical protein DFH27DRAFT_467890, partial [Peziza echinospora]